MLAILYTIFMKVDKAAALKYDKEKDSAPKVVASGKGKIAQMIVEKAKKYDVPLFANEALVETLMGVEIESEIPQELYQAVVEVFVWLAKQENKAAR